MPKPNILIINPDQMRADALHHLGSQASHTPVFDELAAEGVSFSNAFCQNPVCVPSRCSFMTGLYPHTKGHRTMSYLLRPGEENLFSDMKSAGYHTVSSTRGDLMAGQYRKYHKELVDEYLTFSRVRNPATIVKSKRGEKGSDTFFSFFDGIIPENGNGHEIRNTDDLCVDAAVKAIKKRPADKPFFMFVGLNFPHPPYQIEKKYYDLIDASKLQPRIPAIGDGDGKPKMETGLRDALGVSGWDEERMAELRRTYLAMCAKVDSQAGRLVDALKSEGIYDDTAIIVMSDHGDYTGDYGLVEKCQNCFPDCLTNVPLIIKPPADIPVDRGVNDNPAELTDLCATVYDLAGIGKVRQSFSESLLPTMKDRTVPHREYVFCEGGRLNGETHCSESNNLHGADDPYAPRLLLQMKEDGTHTKAAMIRSEEYKYVLRLYEKDEFYILAEGERINRIDDAEYQPVIAKMKEELLLWYMKTCDTVPENYDDRFTDGFMQNNIASVGVPLFLAKAATGVLSLTGGSSSKIIDTVRKRLKL
ncbi:MAG: sulfatase-like hydrolase/transferase [Clostridia bacterium]|nr:sulfatase-like hydrolase/transferase [Clostridia bacterium]